MLLWWAGNLRTVDNYPGGYNLSLLTVQETEIRGMHIT